MRFIRRYDSLVAKHNRGFSQKISWFAIHTSPEIVESVTDGDTALTVVKLPATPVPNNSTPSPNTTSNQSVVSIAGQTPKDLIKKVPDQKIEDAITTNQVLVEERLLTKIINSNVHLFNAPTEMKNSSAMLSNEHLEIVRQYLFKHLRGTFDIAIIQDKSCKLKQNNDGLLQVIKVSFMQVSSEFESTLIDSIKKLNLLKELQDCFTIVRAKQDYYSLTLTFSKEATDVIISSQLPEKRNIFQKN